MNDRIEPSSVIDRIWRLPGPLLFFAVIAVGCGAVLLLVLDEIAAALSKNKRCGSCPIASFRGKSTACYQCQKESQCSTKS